ncbi:predicted protein [Scheffersomyces stipitis CBS 6054]|uniref:Uncharacterized protein n=1 Tax=Scheffersomyces stipitis (strain ATCC 58785 / CBS 6054 / NBRC 10063 / NRRL Y-11545) TaxID=322104 RepID=A3LYU2_PICST|nr:predicted protein [Scheffersomyces stipitis CBS 6054]ABN68037.1 predicted protein [Scheffersomyces stipitis CBS 6054]KAG2731448.1 hypothetical protein G9P44_005864 [Scheffersomyces stipitis]
MPHEIYSYTLEQLDELEGSKITLPEFNTEIAWKIGSYAREQSLVKFPNKAIVIDIQLASGQVLFHTSTGAGATVDNDKWVERKVNVVNRFGKSSFFVGQKLRIKKKPIEEAFLISSLEFATHGGCVPIRIKNLDSVVGTLTISGLAQEEDHLFALQVLENFA